MISSALIAAKIMEAALTVGFFVDTEVKGGCVVADEAVIGERHQDCRLESESSSDMSPEPALESNAVTISRSFTGDGTRCLDCPLEVMRNGPGYRN